jgi:hypothetical protein
MGPFIIAAVDGGEVAYIETAVRGIVTSSRDDGRGTMDVKSIEWRKSTRSSNNGACVELAVARENDEEL